MVWAVIVLLQSPKIKRVDQGKRIFSINNHKTKLPPGPYVIERTTGHLFAVYRLYSDTHSAFVTGIVDGTKPRTSFQETAISASFALDTPGFGAGTTEQAVAIPVPSRLHFTQSRALPLAGVSELSLFHDNY